MKRTLSALVIGAICMLIVTPVRALDKMVAAVHATPAELGAAGMAGVNGTGVTVGVLEAGSGIPFAANLFFGGATIANIPQGGAGRNPDLIKNHATEVTGVIVSQGPVFTGIAPGASIEAAGISTGPEIILNGQDMATTAFGARATVINMSFGNASEPTNGTSLVTRWIDHAAITVTGAAPNSPSPQDILFVVAGNEGEAGRPSDLFNGINVAATGRRSNGLLTGNLIYDREARYNTTNLTTDKSPITRLGRIKTDIIAPGGDPGADPGGPAAPSGTMAAPPAGVNQFVTTGAAGATVAGAAAPGQAEFAFRIPAGCDSPATCTPVYTIDDFNQGGLTDDYFDVVDNQNPPVPGGPGFPSPVAYGPGTDLRGNDTVIASTLAGTSFAAPLVSGAGALLQQYGNANALSTDHKVIKANLLNGASKRTPNGANTLTDQSGAPWGLSVKATDGFVKPNNIGGGFVPIQVGIDPFLGTGQLDVSASGRNYVAGEHNPGPVPNIGWDIHEVLSHGINSYVFPSVGFEHFAATLAWDRLVALQNNVGPAGVWNPGDDFVASPLNDLDLALYFLDPMLGAQLVEFSTSDIDSVEHIFAPLNAMGFYRLDVLNQSLTNETYGLAWRLLNRDPDYYTLNSKYRMIVPEPASMLLLLGGTALLWSRRRGRQ